MVTEASLSHLLLCAGSVGEWKATPAALWQERIALIARAAQAGGAEWATIVPTQPGTTLEVEAVRDLLRDSCGGVHYAHRMVILAEGGVTVIVDPIADGQLRIVEAAARIAPSGEVTEDRLSAAVTAPAPSEPDLVIVLGDATTMPTSLVWELAYAELVFLDVPWVELDAEHLEMAINDFTRRDRRFGGIDS
ncbi:MAG: undecaprenyl diphosphate synthase family protein [Ilumatobacteraceae bacterium]